MTIEAVVDIIISMSSKPFTEEMLVMPKNEKAMQWIRDTIQPADWQWIGEELVMDATDFERLTACLTEDKLTFKRV